MRYSSLVTTHGMRQDKQELRSRRGPVAQMRTGSLALAERSPEWSPPEIMILGIVPLSWWAVLGLNQ